MLRSRCPGRTPASHQRLTRTSITISCSSSTVSSGAPTAPADGMQWLGVDQFTDLNDRKDLPALTLPPTSSAKRVVLVRHGQSTWNAAGIIQGSSDISVLTDKGQQQAGTTRDMLKEASFDALFHSPLERARHTAEIVWDGRPGPVNVLPSLREVDLYGFQGLVKAQGKERYGEEYRQWQQYPHLFEVSGHAPVRELWYRASLAWQDILSTPDSTKVLLVVAHNALNQALLGTALGLAPANFRRFLQSNGATTVLDFLPSSDAATSSPEVVLQHANQEPTAGGTKPGGKVKGGGQLLLLCCRGSVGESDAFKKKWAYRAAPDALVDYQFTEVFHTGDLESLQMTDNVTKIRHKEHGDAEPASHPRMTDLGTPKAEEGSAWWEQLSSTWKEGEVKLVVAPEEHLQALVATALDLPVATRRALRFVLGGISALEVPSGQATAAMDASLAPAGEVPMSAKAKLLHLNSTAHLGEWGPKINDFAA